MAAVIMTDPPSSLTDGRRQSWSYSCAGVLQTCTRHVVGKSVKGDSSDHIIFFYLSIDQALGVSRQIHATTYVETSSRSCPRSAREAFEISALAALGKLNKNHILRTPLSTMNSRGKYKNKDVLKDDLRDRTRNCVLM
ncbi:RNase H domain-containing protein [Trichonephila clavipes]|nr:RNase H domain-containing protein [Trichonephila clavipes]